MLSSLMVKICQRSARGRREVVLFYGGLIGIVISGEGPPVPPVFALQFAIAHYLLSYVAILFPFVFVCVCPLEFILNRQWLHRL